MKRKLLTVFSILLSLIAMLAIFAACGGDEQSDNVDKPTDHTVTEEYYYDANGTEYLISLRSENYFTYSIAGDQAEGTYKLEGGMLTLTPTEGTAVSGTVSGNVLNLTYKENPYTFRLKVNYTVRFDAKGGSSVSDSSVLNGKTVAKPQDPAKTGETFVGWYMDEGFHNAYSFSQRVTGDLTLYARYVAPIDPEFTVSFEGDGTEGIAARTTTGGMLFDLPTPQKEGAEFVGWYVSQSGSPTKLSYRYNEQAIEENITLYAVWDDGSPVVSVSESGVTVENLGVNERYTISIVDSNNVTVKSTTSTDAAFSYDFSSAAAGEYTVTVVLGGKSTVRYFSNKTLAHVTVFKVTGYTLSFNGVKNATGYLLNATCASGHTHTNIEIDPETRSWSFESEGCELPIVFTVTAVADGFASSVSTPFNFTRTLAPVKSLAVSDDTSKVTWGAVENATSYHVSVVKGSDEVLSQNVGNVTEFDLSALDPDTYTVSVTPVARGWLSPDASSSEYKKARLATPQNLNYRNDTVTWDAVKGAASYTVVIDGVEFKDIAETSLSLAGKLKDGQNEHTISVRALPAEGYLASFDSAVFKLVSALSKPAYKGGILSWNAVEGVNSYVVTVDGVSETVTGNSHKVTFTRAGSIFLSVSALYDDGTQSAPQEIAVSVYALTFDMNKEGEKPLQTLYLAEGDPYNFPTDPSFTGNNFVGWRSAPTGGEAIDKDGDKTFDLKQDCTYYAAWAAKKYTITFNAGRYGEMAAGQETFEIEYGARDLALYLPTVTDPNRAFVAWHLVNDVGVLVTEADGSGNLRGAFTQADNVTLYAEYVTVFEFHEYKTGSYSVTMGEGLKQNIVKSIRIPYQYGTGTVTRMEGFLNCTSVTSVEMPDTIEIFDGGNNGERFGGFTALESITVYSAGASAPLFSSDQGVLYFNRNGQIEVACCPMAKSGEVTIREDAKDIAEGAFYKAAKISKVTVAGQITTIHTKAFVDCTALNAIEFNAYTAGNTLTIENDAFSGCSNVETLRLPAYLNNVTAETFKKLTGLNAFEVEGTGDYSAVDGYLCGPYSGNADLKEIIAAPVDKYIENEGKVGTFRVPSGVVSIAEGVFAENSLITDIIIPNWVQNIGKNAFFHLTNLNSITFDEEGQNPLTIGELAFYAGRDEDGSDGNNNALVTKLVLPSNLAKIGANAFGRYSNLKEVTVNADSKICSDGVQYTAAFLDPKNSFVYVETVIVGAACPDFSITDAFGSRVSKVTIDEDNPNFHAIDNVVYNKDMTEIEFFPKDYVGPNGDGAYVIPDGVTRLGGSIFANVTTLTSVTIPASVTEVGISAFLGCRSLRSVTFVEPEENDGGNIFIREDAFRDCVALTDLKLPSRLYQLGAGVFYNCDGLTSVELPKNLAGIEMDGERYTLFDQCDNLASVTVAEGNNSFSTGKNGDVLYHLEPFKLSADGDVDFVEDTLLFVLPNASGTVTVPGTIRHVAKYAFKDIPHVTDIVFENAVKRYNEDGTEDETKYEFKAQAFEGQNSNALTDEYGDYNTSVKSIVLPQGLEEMVDNMISNYRGLKTLTISNTVKTIAPKAIQGSWSVTSIIFEEGGTNPLVIQGEHQSVSSTTSNVSLFGEYITGYGSEDNRLKIESVVLPSRITEIGTYVFFSSLIKSVTFENGELLGELKIGDAAFQNCTDLTNFVFPEGITEIGANAFDNAALDEIKLPESLTKIGGSAFMNTHLTKEQDVLVIPADVTSIGNEAFHYLANVKSVDLSAATGLTSIGEQAFSEMSSLERVTFAANAPEVAMAETKLAALAIGNKAFMLNPALTSVVLPANVSTLGTSAFEQCSALTSVTFETYKDGDKADKSDVKSIGERAFAGTALTGISFPESSTGTLTLSKNLFASCTDLTEVYLSASVKEIKSVFAGCGNLQTVYVAEGSNFRTKENVPVIYDSDGKSVIVAYKAIDGTLNILGTQIGESAFLGQTELKKVIISSDVTTIGANAFKDCINLEEVEFESGSGLQNLGQYAFMNCYALRSINLERCTFLTQLPNGSSSSSLFYHCHALTSVTLPSSVTTLGTYAFAYSGLTSIDLSNCKDMTAIGEGTLNNCAALTSFRFNNNVSTLGKSLFSGCSSLTVADLSPYTKVTMLADSIFSNCTSLKEVYLPDQITYLGIGTFNGCTSLKEIDLTNTKIVHISQTAGSAQSGTNNTSLNVFQNCTSLETVRFPATLKSIGHYTFNGATSLKEVYIGDGAANDLTALTNIHGGPFANSGIEYVKISGNTKFSRYTTTTTADHKAPFENCVNLKKVVFTADTKEIPAYIFYGCSNLTDVNFAELVNLTKINNYAFSGCGFSKLDFSAFPQSLKTASSPFGTNVFENCANLTEVINIFASSNNMFTGCIALRTVSYVDGYSKTFGSNVFQNCISLERIDLSNTKQVALAAYMFDGCESLSTVILSPETNFLGTYTFRNCTSLEEIDLSNTKIKMLSSSASQTVGTTTTSYLFAGCTNLQRVILPEGITQIAGYTFQNCTSLETIENLDVSILIGIGDYAFQNCPAIKGTIVLSADLAVLCDTAFLGCTGITGYALSASGSPSSVNMDGLGSGYAFSSENGLLIAKNASRTIVFSPNSDATIVEDGTLKLPADFELKSYAFYNFSVSSVKRLDLTELNITSVPDHAFQYSMFEEVILPASVTSIGIAAFADTPYLKTVTFLEPEEGEVQPITLAAGSSGPSAASPNHAQFGVFANSAIADTSILSRLEEIPGYAFSGAGITELTIPENITSIGQNAFSGSKVQTVVFECNPTIGTANNTCSIFRSCLDLKTVDLGPCTVIGYQEFIYSGLESITVPNTVTYVGEAAFQECFRLKTVEFASDCKAQFATNMFKKCSLLTKATLPDEFYSTTAGTMGASFFVDCVALEEVKLSQNITAFGASVFSGCTSLKTIEIPKNLKTIGSNVFLNCASLTGDIILPETVTSISTSVFSGCTGINRIVLSATVGTIAANVFANWTADQQICFRDSSFEVVALCSSAWMPSCVAQVVYNYGSEE